MQTNKNNLIVEHSEAFAVSAIKYAELLEMGKKYMDARQFLRAACSIGAMYGKPNMRKVIQASYTR